MLPRFLSHSDAFLALYGDLSLDDQLLAILQPSLSDYSVIAYYLCLYRSDTAPAPLVFRLFGGKEECGTGFLVLRLIFAFGGDMVVNWEAYGWDGCVGYVWNGFGKGFGKGSWRRRRVDKVQHLPPFKLEFEAGYPEFEIAFARISSLSILQFFR